MGRLTDDIVSTAKAFTNNFRDKGNFDYSIESLARVDDLLEELGDHAMEEDDLYNIASMVGCYVFETARKNYCGEYQWHQTAEQPVLVAGLPDFSVAIMAWEKVRDRVNNGKADNIPFYIDGYREHIERGKTEKGYSALIT